MTHENPMRTWIRFWLKRNDHEFAEKVRQEKEERAEMTRRLTEEGRANLQLPADVEELCARYDRERHERNQFPVGAFLDIIDSQRHGGVKATADQLLVVAEVGADLFYAAICTADDEDNAEFFITAYERWGELVDTALQECCRQNRDVMTGRVRALR